MENISFIIKSIKQNDKKFDPKRTISKILFSNLTVIRFCENCECSTQLDLGWRQNYCSKYCQTRMQNLRFINNFIVFLFYLF
jgi:hypothetical protein